MKGHQVMFRLGGTSVCGQIAGVMACQVWPGSAVVTGRLNVKQCTFRGECGAASVRWRWGWWMRWAASPEQ